MWTYSLKLSLRSLARELARNLWGRVLVYPVLARNERSSASLNAYIARRARALRVPAPPDGTRLSHVGPGARLLAKQELRQHPERFVRPRKLGSLIRNTIKTSGTSGSPLTLVQTLGAVIREEGFVYRQLRWIGYRHGQRRAWIRGDIVCDEQPRDGRYWCRDWIGNMLMMSSYHLSSATIGAYVEALERFDPVVIHAYPSSIAAIANWLNAAGRSYQGRALRGVMTSSETLEPDVRAAVSRAFGVTVFDWYGQAERVSAIGTCEHGNYHLLTDYAAVELLAREEGACELVGTSLNNPAMPLSRYRTGDTVIPGAPEPCPCGRVFPTVKAIVGRQEKIITLPDGRIIARLDRIFQGHDRNLVEGQVLYHRNGRFTLRVVTTDGFGPADEAALAEKFLLRVPGVPVAVQRVAAIPRGPNGKFEFIALDA
ncbi:phenylacetate--CoA ligase family protein [Massilia niastensis]|uniref:phenylacetate--CoA ligase family protein n=1 Tax=Massilia niastensis TaxID=544911 RepID=UPI00035D127E|nr:phenylacetate--CoA ligase family protein [Massilia niastensis]